MNFYFEAVNVLDKLDAKKGSIKGVLASVPEKNRKRTAALVIETLKYKQVLSEVIEAAQLLKQEKKITSRNLALVLVHDLLLSRGIQAGDGPIKQAVLRHKTRLTSEFTRAKLKRGAKSNEELAQTDDSRAASIPRYIRVNRTCWTMKDALKTFQAQGYELGDPLSSPKSFKQDDHIPDLLAFHPSARFVDDPLYLSGKIILQDKASCFPAHILAPPARDNAVVIDATAAPGNKTSHLCAIMQNKGKLYAFERDRKRFSTLKTMLSKAHCTNVEAVNSDFLTISSSDPKFGRATHILLDPSCSGSGIVNRMDHLLAAEQEEDDDSDRLNKLAAFQLKMIRHAMTFPSVQRIVYSTCSVHAIENEHVVRQALKTEEATTGGFRLARRNQVLPNWHRRGFPEKLDDPVNADALVRCSPGEDATNGFFVSLFVRGDEDDASERAMKKRKEPAEAHDSPEQPATKRKKKKKKTVKATET
ncbi:S-adenosyl-L-methionine-dependent methyltransferase [Lentinus tigrinus ALCF2SS1-7]|uniref:S-adenosyl-L-methionine-dependent methyltransferase n=1 Tax=Lentinus tigrinus ALCF2SS1-6 TaxID=1328759 RepID=A0A5C2SBF6_9APHY|nr:S-adenosyl-L-methionine-dependent methyltransferase [Lentinus tigrinus ALCF2SS1-6]RPD75246.1 S-adenosyl-L-methionine-dependent methyltransferase [Lentinus tigrinus ALCF2SS1-7]